MIGGHLTLEELFKRFKQDPAAAKAFLAEIVAEMTKEYLTINEVAKRLSMHKQTVKNKMAAGILRKGIHYFSPQGMGPRFKWTAVQAWLEGNQVQKPEAIPMRNGYNLNTSNSAIWDRKELASSNRSRK
jgi:excisionase family DNA binding protein